MKAVLMALRKARKEHRGLDLDEVLQMMRIDAPFNKQELEQNLKQKFPYQNNGINPAHILRAAIVLTIAKNLDPALNMIDYSEFQIEYAASKELYHDLQKNIQISKLSEQIKRHYKELPKWVKLGTDKI
jgi:hypothetical protein